MKHDEIIKAFQEIDKKAIDLYREANHYKNSIRLLAVAALNFSTAIEEILFCFQENDTL